MFLRLCGPPSTPTEPEQPTEPPIDGEATNDPQQTVTEPVVPPTEPAEPAAPTDPTVPQEPSEPTNPETPQSPDQEPTDIGNPDDAYVIPPEEAGTP